jgi:hypothetical protein
MDTVFIIAAVFGGTILVLQFLLSLLGLGDHHHGDLGGLHHVDASSAGLPVGHDTSWEHGGGDPGHVSNWFYEIISIRTVAAGACFFGLAGSACLAMGYSPAGSFILALVAGGGAMYGVYWLYKQVYKLQHSGTENIRNAIGAPAVVYVPIPANRSGAGKVTFKLQNRHVEYLAVTDDDTRLATGEKVAVVAVVGSDTVLVARTAVPDEALVSNTTTA